MEYQYQIYQVSSEVFKQVGIGDRYRGGVCIDGTHDGGDDLLIIRYSEDDDDANTIVSYSEELA